MKFLVLGNGASGRAAAALAARLGHETVTLEGDDAFPDPSSGAPFDGAIVSPGIPLGHPWQVACRAAGIPPVSELQFGCEELRRRGWKLLAVTGSKGKSSVAKLVADALAAAGARAVPCGNYGRPVSDVALEGVGAEDARREIRDASGDARRKDASGDARRKDASGDGRRRDGRADARDARWAVVEVSSFQLETTTLAADTFEAAVILNLQEDHLDRHGSVAAYHALKRKLLSFAKTGKTMSPGTTGVRQQEKDLALLAGSYFDNEILRANGAAAVFLLRAAGLADAEIAAAFAGFEPLPHRMRRVGVFRGVTCVDDSKATSLAALAAGVTMAGDSIRLIAGGLPKGDNPKDVLPVLTERVKKVYLIGRSAELFATAWSGAVDCEICGTMERAVRAAMREAESGETVLLSPGTASFDQFHSFGERGDVFADLIKKEGTDK